MVDVLGCEIKAGDVLFHPASSGFHIAQGEGERGGQKVLKTYAHVSYWDDSAEPGQKWKTRIQTWYLEYPERCIVVNPEQYNDKIKAMVAEVNSGNRD